MKWKDRSDIKGSNSERPLTPRSPGEIKDKLSRGVIDNEGWTIKDVLSSRRQIPRCYWQFDSDFAEWSDSLVLATVTPWSKIPQCYSIVIDTVQSESQILLTVALTSQTNKLALAIWSPIPSVIDSDSAASSSQRYWQTLRNQVSVVERWHRCFSPYVCYWQWDRALRL